MYSTPFHKEDISKKNFLVTGGAGFIGSNIVEYLLKHNAGKVTVLDNLSTGSYHNLLEFKSHPSLNFIEGDIRNISDCEKACKNTEYIFHQAALGSVPRSIKNPIDTHQVNSTGFINILMAAKNAEVRRIVYASSSSVYGDSPLLPKVEENIGKQLSPYAVSKMTNELYGEIFAKTYAMEIVGLRYFNIFGPKQDPGGDYAAAIPLFIRAILQDQTIKINGDGEQTRDFTFVSNAVKANILAIFADQNLTSGKVFNIAAGKRTSLNTLIDLLKIMSSKKEIKVKHVEARPGDVRDSLADISKARTLLHYEPEVSLEEGLQTTLNWFHTAFKI